MAFLTSDQEAKLHTTNLTAIMVDMVVFIVLYLVNYVKRIIIFTSLLNRLLHLLEVVMREIYNSI